MKSSTFVTILGLAIAFIPYSGLYEYWKDAIVSILGILVFIVGLYVSNKKRLVKFLIKEIQKENINNNPKIAESKKEKSDKGSYIEKIEEVEEVEVIYKN